MHRGMFAVSLGFRSTRIAPSKTVDFQSQFTQGYRNIENRSREKVLPVFLYVLILARILCQTILKTILQLSIRLGAKALKLRGSHLDDVSVLSVQSILLRIINGLAHFAVPFCVPFIWPPSKFQRNRGKPASSSHPSFKQLGLKLEGILTGHPFRAPFVHTVLFER